MHCLNKFSLSWTKKIPHINQMQEKKNSQMEVRNKSILISEEDEEEQNSTLKIRWIPRIMALYTRKPLSFRLKDARVTVDF